MGQKVNPISLRLEKTNKNFDSCWHSDLYYSERLSEDLKIKSYFSNLFKQLRFRESSALSESGENFSFTCLPKKIKLLAFYLNPKKSRHGRCRSFHLVIKRKKKRKAGKNKTRRLDKKRKLYRAKQDKKRGGVGRYPKILFFRGRSVDLFSPLSNPFLKVTSKKRLLSKKNKKGVTSTLGLKRAELSPVRRRKWKPAQKRGFKPDPAGYWRGPRVRGRGDKAAPNYLSRKGSSFFTSFTSTCNLFFADIGLEVEREGSSLGFRGLERASRREQTRFREVKGEQSSLTSQALLGRSESFALPKPPGFPLPDSKAKVERSERFREREAGRAKLSLNLPEEETPKQRLGGQRDLGRLREREEETPKQRLGDQRANLSLSLPKPPLTSLNLPKPLLTSRSSAPSNPSFAWVRGERGFEKAELSSKLSLNLSRVKGPDIWKKGKACQVWEKRFLVRSLILLAFLQKWRQPFREFQTGQRVLGRLRESSALLPPKQRLGVPSSLSDLQSKGWEVRHLSLPKWRAGFLSPKSRFRGLGRLREVKGEGRRDSQPALARSEREEETPNLCLGVSSSLSRKAKLSLTQAKLGSELSGSRALSETGLGRGLSKPAFQLRKNSFSLIETIRRLKFFQAIRADCLLGKQAGTQILGKLNKRLKGLERAELSPNLLKPPERKNRQNAGYIARVEDLLSQEFSSQVRVYFYKGRWDSQSAYFLANEVVYYLQRRVAFRRIKSQLIDEIKKKQAAWKSVEGIRICCSGRVRARSKKAQRARQTSFQWGQTSLHVFSSKLSFAYKNASTQLGQIGVKVWICYK